MAHNSSSWKLFKNLHLADAEEDFFAYYKLEEKREAKKTEGKKSELPDNYPVCITHIAITPTPLRQRSSKHRQASS